MGCGYAATEHHSKVEVELLALFQKILQGASPLDIGEFMGVGNRRGCALRERDFFKAGRGQKAAFDMDMRVNKAWDDCFSLRLDHPGTLKTGVRRNNEALMNPNVRRFPGAGEDIEVGSVF